MMLVCLSRGFLSGHITHTHTHREREREETHTQTTINENRGTEHHGIREGEVKKNGKGMEWQKEGLRKAKRAGNWDTLLHAAQCGRPVSFQMQRAGRGALLFRMSSTMTSI